MNFVMTLLVSTCISIAPMVNAEIYQWKDNDGVLQFGDKRAANDRQDRQMVFLRGIKSEKQHMFALKNDIGKIVTKKVAHGRYQQYIPKNGLEDIKIVVVNHGMFSDDETAIVSARKTLDDWMPFADQTKSIIVAPAFDNHSYAATEPGARNGGYRGLYGRRVGADAFLHEIIREYQFADGHYDGRFYLSGHSAGAQFANRYLVRHPERVIAAAFSAPAWFALPSKEHNWPYGMGQRRFTSLWPGERVGRIVDIRPDPTGWLTATQVPVAVVVGELDLDRMRHVAGIGGDTHVGRAEFWVKEMNSYAARYGKTGRVEMILVPKVGHVYGRLARICQRYIHAQMYQ